MSADLSVDDEETVKELYQELEEKDERIEELEAHIEALSRKVDRLKTALTPREEFDEEPFLMNVTREIRDIKHQEIEFGDPSEYKLDINKLVHNYRAGIEMQVREMGAAVVWMNFEDHVDMNARNKTWRITSGDVKAILSQEGRSDSRMKDEWKYNEVYRVMKELDDQTGGEVEYRHPKGSGQEKHEVVVFGEMLEERLEDEN